MNWSRFSSGSDNDAGAAERLQELADARRERRRDERVEAELEAASLKPETVARLRAEHASLLEACRKALTMFDAPHFDTNRRHAIRDELGCAVEVVERAATLPTGK